jgi:hypothetical protein
MKSAHPLAVAVCLILSSQVVAAQDLSRYRVYALGSNVASVIASTGTPMEAANTLYARPAIIQELEWRAPYVLSGSAAADPVREIAFTFHNDALYQVVVTYDRDRTEGLTNSDIIQSLSATYGAASLASATKRIDLPAGALSDSTVLARWENLESSLTLVRTFPSDFQLILISKAVSARARTAIREAIRLDGIEAPRRQAALLKKEATDAGAVRDKTRLANKAAFRP